MMRNLVNGIAFRRGMTCLAAILMLCGYSYGASAQHITPQREAGADVTIAGMDVNIHASISILNGESKELVYYTSGAATGQKLSELIWTFDNTTMLGGGLSISPLSWLTLNADAWMAVHKDSATMDDYDWLGASGGGGNDRPVDWDHWSHHEDTKVDKAYMLDISAEINTYQNDNFLLKGIVGFKRDFFKWKSSGGTYTYSRNPLNSADAYAYRGYTGTITGLGITYQQEFNTPYLGIGSVWNSGRWQLDGRVIASAWVDVKDKDIHHLRDLTFIEEFEKGKMIAIDLGGSYKLTNNLSLGASYHYQDYSTVKGTTTVINNLTNASTFHGGESAGASHKSHMVSASLKYKFNTWGE